MMRHYSFLVTILLIATTGYASDPFFEWSRVYPTPHQERVRALALTEDDGFLVVGSLNYVGPGIPRELGCPTNSCRISEAWAAKTDSAGELQWSRSLSAPTSSVATGVCKIGEYYVVTMDLGLSDDTTRNSAGYLSFRHVCSLALLNAQGDIVSSSIIPDTTRILRDVKMSPGPSGAVIVGQECRDSSRRSLQLWMTSPGLSSEWNWRYITEVNGHDFALCSTNDSCIIVSGMNTRERRRLEIPETWFVGKLTLEGDTVWWRELPGSQYVSDIVETHDGFLIGGSCLLARFRSDGESIWERRDRWRGESYWAHSVSVCPGYGAGYIIAGDSFYGFAYCPLVMRVDEAGNAYWIYPAGHESGGRCIAPAYSSGATYADMVSVSDGRYVLAGHTNPHPNGEPDLLLAKISVPGLSSRE